MSKLNKVTFTFVPLTERGIYPELCWYCESTKQVDPEHPDPFEDPTFLTIGQGRSKIEAYRDYEAKLNMKSQNNS